jgi:glycosyltransferase involved in cell wall biosynthesis
MNIAIDIRSLLDNKPGGVGRYTFHLLDAFFRNDKTNQYFLFYNSFRKGQNIFQEKWGNLPNVHFCAFRWPNKILNFCLRFFHWPKLDVLISNRTKRTKIDIFFIPNLNFISLSEGVKKIITVHDLSFERYPSFFSWKSRFWHWLVEPRKLINSCEKIIAVSENTKRDLIELYGISPEKIQVIYSGIEYQYTTQEIQSVRQKYNLPEHFILFLGTLEPRKNIIGLIQAFEILKEKYKFPNLQLVIVGRCGWSYQKIFRRVRKSRFAQEIRFIDYIEDGEKFAFYKLADLFVYPSFYEGFGFPPLEAAKTGLPVIVSHASSLPEIFGGIAILVNPYNVAEMAEAMFQCLVNKKLRVEVEKKIDKQLEKFNWERCAEETKRLFEIVFEFQNLKNAKVDNDVN